MSQKYRKHFQKKTTFSKSQNTLMFLIRKLIKIFTQLEFTSYNAINLDFNLTNFNSNIKQSLQNFLNNKILDYKINYQKSVYKKKEIVITPEIKIKILTYKENIINEITIQIVQITNQKNKHYILRM